MKSIGILSQTEVELINRCMYARVSKELTEDIIFAPCPSPIQTDKILVNSSPAAFAFGMEKEIQEQIFNYIGVTDKPSISMIYGYVGCKEYLEVCITNKLMNGDVGVPVAAATAVAIKIPYEVTDAVPQFNKVQEVLRDMKYKGEFVVGLSADFSITGVTLGHKPELFGLMVELIKTDVQALVEAMASSTPLEYHDDIAVGLLVSKPPFPYPAPSGELKVPANAEKHVWKLPVQGGEIGFITTHGRSFAEAKRRAYHTANNIKRFFPYLQYRTDLGYGIQFVICKEQYESYIKSRRTNEVSRSNNTCAGKSQAIENDTVCVEVVG